MGIEDKLKRIKKLADAMYNAAAYLGPVGSGERLHKTMDNYHQFIIHEYYKEETISEDLDKAAKHHLYSNILYDDVYVGNPTEEDCIEMFKAGVKWQREQMMKDAVDGLVYAQLTTSGKIMIRSNYFKSETLDYLDNVKLIIIKEDKV